MTHASKSVAIASLERIFAQSPDSDEVTPELIFKTTGRQNYSDQANRQWLLNKLTQLRRHNLITTVHSFTGKKRLKAVQLTLGGKMALGRIGRSGAPSSISNAVEPNLPNILAAIEQLKMQYPEYEISFKMTPKPSSKS